eukprot:m.722165 g.722165  ORF g.722165 m.722165 type:complete len:202 (-) comp58821_c0_seq9:43-648(-)
MVHCALVTSVLLALLAPVALGGQVTIYLFAGQFPRQKYGLIWFDPDPYPIFKIGSESHQWSTQHDQSVNWNGEAYSFGGNYAVTDVLRYDVMDDTALYDDHNMLNGNFAVDLDSKTTNSRSLTLGSGGTWLNIQIRFIPDNKCLAVTNGGCSSGYYCVFDDDKKSHCEPINFCNTNNGGCNHTCTYTDPLSSNVHAELATH